MNEYYDHDRHDATKKLLLNNETHLTRDLEEWGVEVGFVGVSKLYSICIHLWSLVCFHVVSDEEGRLTHLQTINTIIGLLVRFING